MDTHRTNSNWGRKEKRTKGTNCLQLHSHNLSVNKLKLKWFSNTVSSWRTGEHSIPTRPDSWNARNKRIKRIISPAEHKQFLWMGDKQNWQQDATGTGRQTVIDTPGTHQGMTRAERESERENDTRCQLYKIMICFGRLSPWCSPKRHSTVQHDSTQIANNWKENRKKDILPVEI